MREILFRAKRKNWHELPKEEWWVEGYYCYFMNEHCILPKNLDADAALFGQQKVFVIIEPETLCQYTELKDNNGKRIWENDILHIVEKMGNDVYHNGNLVSSPRWINEFNFKVEFTPGGLMNTKRFANAPQIECEVIGNIFDNPELLEGESV